MSLKRACVFKKYRGRFKKPLNDRPKATEQFRGGGDIAQSDLFNFIISVSSSYIIK